MLGYVKKQAHSVISGHYIDASKAFKITLQGLKSNEMLEGSFLQGDFSEAQGVIYNPSLGDTKEDGRTVKLYEIQAMNNG